MKTGHPFYSADLAYIHDVGFGAYARRAAPEIVRLLRSRGLRRGRVVEFGCGGGTLAQHLIAAGYEVIGIDISREMLRLARARAPAAVFRVGSLATATIPRCSAIIAIGEVVSYVAAKFRKREKEATKTRKHETELGRFFERAFNALLPGGLLVFDFMESAAGRTYEQKTRAGRDWAIELSADVNGSGRLLTRRITTVRKLGRKYRRSHEIHQIRIYPRQQLFGALARVGFDVTIRRSLGRVRLIKSDVIVIAFKPSV
jgi:SAM-dependent methyltransferase